MVVHIVIPIAISVSGPTVVPVFGPIVSVVVISSSSVIVLVLISAV